MKIKMLVGLSGPTFTLQPGDPHECEDAEASRLISARYALPWIDDGIERAEEAPAPETRPKRGNSKKDKA